MPSDLETLDDEQQPQQADSPVIANLRKDREDALAETANLKRELVVHKAGLTGLSDKQLKALTAAHEGDWEPDALKATATELGFGTPTAGEQPAEPQIPAGELDAHRRTAAAANGEPPAPPPDLTDQILAEPDNAKIKTLLRNNGMLAEDN